MLIIYNVLQVYRISCFTIFATMCPTLFVLQVNDEIRTMTIGDLKHQELPLARIKKIMKLDEDVKVAGYTRRMRLQRRSYVNFLFLFS